MVAWSLLPVDFGDGAVKRSLFMRALILLVVIIVSAMAGPVPPARAADDAAAAQTIIRSQVEAFGRDDASAAYAYAAPAIRDVFAPAETFMAMVRNSYAPIYRHRSFEFGEARTSDGRIAQRVHIVDSEGEAWEALYTLELQSDGTLKILGCVLGREPII
jgi:Domain of unknown function (DUF4864)